jgi:hypothetical protein
MVKTLELMTSATLEEKYTYFRNYNIGRILLVVGYIPFLIYFGFIMYIEQSILSARANSTTISNSTGSYFFGVLQYFPIIIIFTMVFSILGRRIMIRSIENILGKTRYELSPVEYRRAVREIKLSMKDRKSGAMGDSKTDSTNSHSAVNASNEEDSSPFSK